MQCTPVDKKALGALASALQEISIIEARMQTLTERVRLEELKQQRAEERRHHTMKRVQGREQRTDVLRLRQEVAKLKQREAADRDELREVTDKEKRKDLKHDLAATQSRLEDFEERLGRAERTAIMLDEDLPEFSANGSPEATGSAPSDGEIAEAQRALQQAENALQADLQAAQTCADQARHEMAPAVLEVFEKQYEEHGVGAAWLNGRTCGGCFMELDPLTLRELRRAPAGELQHCPECNVIILLPED